MRLDGDTLCGAKGLLLQQGILALFKLGALDVPRGTCGALRLSDHLSDDCWSHAAAPAECLHRVLMAERVTL